MKAEINNKNKVKFFALYWAQKVFVNPLLGDEPVRNTYLFTEDEPEDISYEYLQLKPLSSISDEDAIELGYSTCDDPLNSNYGMSASGCFFDDWTQREEMLMSDSDYLRSKGYALPWMGLSVEEMVEAGWIKLT